MRIIKFCVDDAMFEKMRKDKESKNLEWADYIQKLFGDSTNVRGKKKNARI